MIDTREKPLYGIIAIFIITITCASINYREPTNEKFIVKMSAAVKPTTLTTTQTTNSTEPINEEVRSVPDDFHKRSLIYMQCKLMTTSICLT